MCQISVDDYCAVWKNSYPVARKQHKCQCCGMAIEKGEKYLKHFNVYDGYPSDERACMVCATLWETFFDAHGGGLSPNSLEEMLDECIQEGSTSRRWFNSDESWFEARSAARKVTRQWRSYLAILKYRQRKARRSRGPENQEASG
jgi:hypothetical protein